MSEDESDHDLILSSPKKEQGMVMATLLISRQRGDRGDHDLAPSLPKGLKIKVTMTSSPHLPEVTPYLPRIPSQSSQMREDRGAHDLIPFIPKKEKGMVMATLLLSI